MVQAAVWGFCQRARSGRFAGVTGRADLWRVLHAAVIRRAYDTVRDASRQKRGGLATAGNGDVGNVAVLADPGAELENTEELLKMLDRLALAGGDGWRIALGKLAGRSNEEIAAALAMGPATLKRRLGEMREVFAGLVKAGYARRRGQRSGARFQ